MDTFIDYYKSVDVLDAQGFLRDISASSFPNLKKDKQQSILQKLKNVAYKTVKKDNPRLATIQSVLDNLSGKR